MNSAPATSTDAATAAWLCGLLQAGDSYYPTGSYAHSFGLEALVHAGVVRDRATLRAFLFQSALPGLERTDLPLVTHAWRALDGPDWPMVRELSVRSAALKSAQEARMASENIGRQRAELAARLHPGSIAEEYVRRATAGHWPFASGISAAVEARALNAPLVAALASYTYATISALLAAAMKLLRLGQNGAQTLLAEALAEAPRLMAAAAETVALDDIGWFNPWLDIAAARHEAADARMFIS